MRVADYIFQQLADWGTRHVFLVTGGGAMHLNDALGQETRIRYICNHHEQACALAAEGYARMTGTLGVVSVTTGPGGTNALTGVYSAWMDSIPLLIISGQIKRELCMASYPELPLRQLGDQEADIIALARPITKYAVLVDDPASIRYHLERAYHLAQSGRPGPCWLDIPLDVQASIIDPDTLAGYDPAEDALPADPRLPAQCAEVLRRLQEAKRPVILAGSGIRQAQMIPAFRALVERLGIPVVASRTACDLLPYAHPCYCGRAGIDADRAGNFTVQNADCLLVLGSRLNTRQISYNFNSFARAAYTIQVDIDAAELAKPTFSADLPLHADLRDFLPILLAQLDAQPDEVDFADWVAWGKARLAAYTGDLPATDQTPDGPLHPYYFLQQLFTLLHEDDVLACGNGAAFIMTAQAARLRGDQRLFFNSGCAAMGFDLPAALGAAVGHDGRRVICVAGDGSIQMNIQELQTIAHHRLPVKIILLNNQGYLSIRSTQQHFFGRTVGEGPNSGVSFPDFCKLAEVYGIPSARITSADPASLMAALQPLLDAPGPALCEVMVDPAIPFEPRASSKILPDGRMVSAPLEDMYPFLPRDEFLANMLIPPVAE